jgi:protein SERAC1
MASSPRSTVFRVTGLPVDKAVLDVKSTLTQTIRDLLTEDERQQVEVSVTCIPSCDEIPTSSALVEFKGGNPDFLAQLDHTPLGDWQVEMGGEDINFDRHFFGFTQLYPTDPDNPVTAEYDLCHCLQPRY